MNEMDKEKKLVRDIQKQFQDHKGEFTKDQIDDLTHSVDDLLVKLKKNLKDLKEYNNERNG